MASGGFVSFAFAPTLSTLLWGYRGRFIRVDAVMDPTSRSEERSLPKLKSGSTLEVAAKELTNSSYDTAVVTGDGGQPLGLVSLRQITAALSSTVERRLVVTV